jgi:hypothetical protein
MYNVQIIPTHNKQTYCEKPFPKNMDNFKKSSINKIEKKNHFPSLA